MANKDAAFGLRPVKMLSGNKIPMRKYANKGATTAIWAGDIVVLQAADMRVLRLATTTPDADTVGVAANYVAAGTAGQDLWVYDDPNTIFEVQSEGTTDADHWDLVGTMAVLNKPTGNTTTGLSKLELDYSSAGTGTASDNSVKVVGVSKHAQNDASSSHAVVEVMLVNHMFGDRMLTASV